MLLSEHVYCVTVTFKMTRRVEQQICIKFGVKLNHSSTETILMIQKAEDSSRQCARSGIASHTVFWWNQITQVTQAPYSPDLALFDFWLLPK